MFPLWRDKSVTQPNASESVTAELSARYGRWVTGEQLWHYCAGLLGTAAYTERWHKELTKTAPRVPFPQNEEDFDSLVNIGRRLVETARGQNLNRSQVGVVPTSGPEGSAPLPTFVPNQYNPDTETLKLDNGLTFTGITAELWEHEISGYRTLQRWVKSRSNDPGGRVHQKSSPLEEERPRHWVFSNDLIRICDQISTLNALVHLARPIVDRL